MVVLEQLAAHSWLVVLLGGVDLSDEILLGRRGARDGQVVGRDKVDVQRVVEETVIEALRQHVVLRVAGSAEQLGIELEIVLGKPLRKVIDARNSEMAEV